MHTAYLCKITVIVNGNREHTMTGFGYNKCICSKADIVSFVFHRSAKEQTNQPTIEWMYKMNAENSKSVQYLCERRAQISQFKLLTGRHVQNCVTNISFECTNYSVRIITRIHRTNAYKIHFGEHIPSGQIHGFI